MLEPMEESSVETRRHPLARCEDCGLNTKDSKFCPSDGPPTAEIVVVGEAPGFREAKEGRPFTGPSGRLLDLVLKHHGIDRGSVFVTNTCLCRPADNRTPTKSEIACCAPRLKQEVQSRSPRAILALGNTAVSAIVGQKVSITSYRVGPAKTSPLYPGVDIIATVHPAFILRSADSFPMLVNDVGKLRPDIRITFEPPKWVAYDEADKARAALVQLGGRYDTLVVDIETGVEKDTAFEHSDRHQLLCVGFAYAPGKGLIIGESACKDVDVRRIMGGLLEDKKVVCHNGKFDLAGLRAIGKGTLHFDTMLSSYVLDERPGTHGLKYLAVELLGAPQYDLELQRYLSKGDSYAVIPRDVLYQYNAYDVACTWDLMEYYQKRFTESDFKLQSMLCRASDMLMLSEMEGIKVDQTHLDYLTDHYMDGLSDLERKLHTWVDNPRSPMQVKAALEAWGIRTSSTDEDHLHAIQAAVKPSHSKYDDIQEFLRLLLEHRREQKLYGTYVKGIRKRLWKGRVYPTFLLHGSVTGRLACRNPNLQNVPRESSIRRMFVPEEGNVFVQADYAAVELRVIACLARDEALRTIFNEGRDIHNEVALRFFGEGFTKEQRVRAKAVVYGLSYGREAYSLAQEFGIPVTEAAKYLKTFFELIPEVSKWRDGIQHQILHDQEDLVTYFGRHRRFWLITEDNKKDVVKEGLAFLPQSTASDICLNAAIRLRDRGIHIRIPVHDSLLAECPVDQAEEVARVMSEVMSETGRELFDDYCTWPVEVNTGNAWSEV